MVSVSLQDIHQLINRYQLITSHLPHSPPIVGASLLWLEWPGALFSHHAKFHICFSSLLTSWVISGVSSWCKDNVFDKNSLLFPGSQNGSSSLAWGNHWSASPNQICVEEVLHKHLKVFIEVCYACWVFNRSFCGNTSVHWSTENANLLD